VTRRLYGGSLDEFEGSMAADIEDALHDVALEEGLDPPPDDDGRRMLFVAIARGVIEHLRRNEEAFRIRIEGTAFPVETSPDIEVRT